MRTHKEKEEAKKCREEGEGEAVEGGKEKVRGDSPDLTLQAFPPAQLPDLQLGWIPHLNGYNLSSNRSPNQISISIGYHPCCKWKEQCLTLQAAISLLQAVADVP